MSHPANDIIWEQLYEESVDRSDADLMNEMPESVRNTIEIKNNNEDGLNGERILETYLQWRFDNLPEAV